MMVLTVTLVPFVSLDKLLAKERFIVLVKLYCGISPEGIIASSLAMKIILPKSVDNISGK